MNEDLDLSDELELLKTDFTKAIVKRWGDIGLHVAEQYRDEVIKTVNNIHEDEDHVNLAQAGKYLGALQLQINLSK